jgi:cob(I)alamin adenosyltransferase
MKIYTKTGDAGTTSLFGGKRVPKHHLRIETYGTVDELNCLIGLVADQEVNKNRLDLLRGIQSTLFTLGSHLAAEPGKKHAYLPQLNDSMPEPLEAEIDAMDAQLPPLKNFILPGGHPSVSYCHLARTVCRRAERLVVALSEVEEINPIIIKYLNRLSDYFFVLARKMGSELQVEEIPWHSK